MLDYIEETYEDSFLEHHGILGQKWGIRRFQNYDGTLKAAGKRRAKTDRDKERAERKKARAEKKEAKAQAKAEKAKEDLEKAKARAIASADLNEIMKLRGSMTTEELKEASARALAIGQVNKNMPKEKSRIEKLVGAMKTGKEVADSIKGMHESLSSLRKEFGLDAKSILNDNSDGQMTLSDWARQNKEPDIFDRIKETTGKIAKDAANKASEKYHEKKLNSQLKEASNRIKDKETLDWLEKLNGGKKESSQPKANFDSGFKLKDGDYSVFNSSSRDLSSNKEAGSAISDFIKSVNSSGSKGNSGNSSVDLPSLSLPWSSSVSSKAANTKISDVSKPSRQTQKAIDRLIKKGSKAGDMTIDDLHADQSAAIERINKALGR